MIEISNLDLVNDLAKVADYMEYTNSSHYPVLQYSIKYKDMAPILNIVQRYEFLTH